MNLILRKERFLNFLLFGLLRIVQLLRGIVAAPRLDGVLLFLRQRTLSVWYFPSIF